MLYVTRFLHYNQNRQDNWDEKIFWFQGVDDQTAPYLTILMSLVNIVLTCRDTVYNLFLVVSRD